MDIIEALAVAKMAEEKKEEGRKVTMYENALIVIANAYSQTEIIRTPSARTPHLMDIKEIN